MITAKDEGGRMKAELRQMLGVERRAAREIAALCMPGIAVSGGRLPRGLLEQHARGG